MLAWTRQARIPYSGWVHLPPDHVLAQRLDQLPWRTWPGGQGVGPHQWVAWRQDRALSAALGERLKGPGTWRAPYRTADGRELMGRYVLLDGHKYWIAAHQLCREPWPADAP
jgi:hypothetical protein